MHYARGVETQHDVVRSRELPPAMHPALTAYHWLRRPLEYWDQQHARYGDVFAMRLPALPLMAVFCNPSDVKEIFTDDGTTLAAGKFNKSLSAFLGENSVLMLDGREHLRHRRLLLPPFHGERMHAYAREMIELTNAAISRWPVGTPFAIHSEMQSVTLRVIVRTIFGVDDGPRFEHLVSLLTELTDLASWPPLLLPFMQIDLGPWSPWGRFKRKGNAVDAALRDEIQRRRSQGTTGRVDILSLLVDARDESGAPMTDDELVDELGTLLVAGHETTATSLAWAFRWVLDSPAVLARLQTEIAEACESGRPVAEKVAALPYLDAVVREALRLSPVIPLVGRILEKPTRVAGYDLPAGSAVLCSIYLAQRRESVFPHASRFDPDRFLGTKFSPYEFFPFGGGVRRCIGMAFALYEMKMVLATVIARCTLRPASGRPIRVVRRAITLTPSDGMPVVMTDRRALG